MAMRRKRLARLLWKLRAMRHSLPSRDQLLLRIGAAKKEAGRAFGFVKIQLPSKDQAVTHDSFRFQLDKDRLKQAEHRDGYYLLRSNLTAEDPAVIWTLYVQLTQIEAVFRSLKSELDIRPIYHQKEDRIDAHIFIAPEQIQAEIERELNLIKEIYDVFGFTDVKIGLSTRPEKRIGTDAMWDHAEDVLRRILKQIEENIKRFQADDKF